MVSQTLENEPSVSIMISVLIGQPGILSSITGGGRNCSHFLCVQTDFRAIQPFALLLHEFLSPGVKGLGCEAEHSGWSGGKSCIRHVLCSNLGRNIAYPDEYFSRLPPSIEVNTLWYINYVMTAYFQQFRVQSYYHLTIYIYSVI